MPDLPLGEPTRDPLLVRVLSRWIGGVVHRPILVLVCSLAATLVFGNYAVGHLGFNADPNALFSEDLRFQKMIREFGRYFPVLTDSLLIVVDGETPEAQLALTAALAERHDAFHRVFLPGEEPFFERVGLLYASVDELYEFSDSMAQLQPIIGELSRDPSLPTLARVIEQGLEQSEVAPETWERVFGEFSTATVSVYDEFPIAVSWQSLMLADTGFDPTPLRVIVADPVLDLERVLAAEFAIETVRETAAALSLGPERGVRVRVTGYPALNDEEMRTLAGDSSLAGSLSFVLVLVVLTLAFRSFRVVLAAAVSLVVGLIWTAGFAAAAVSELNPVSMTVSVLLIGLGVDFMIHLGMHFTESARQGAGVEAALQAAVRETGTALVLCATTTTVGFLAFVPTDYRGLSDLGLAASGGILVLLFQALTLFPALLALLMTKPARARLARRAHRADVSLPVLPAVPVCVVALALAVASLPLVPLADLDTNVIRLRNPSTESVQAFEDLLASREATPWYLDALAPSLDEAIRLAEELRVLDTVDRVVTLADFVPEQQSEKREVLADVAFFLDLPPASKKPAPTVEEQIAALAKLQAFLDADAVSQGDAPLARSARRLRDAIGTFLARVESEGDAALADLERLLVHPFPVQFDRLRAELEPGTITLEALPPGLVSRMLAEDGHARLQVYPAESLWDHATMVEFVESVREVWPDITGLPVNLVESAQATWSSLREALLWAGLAILLLLLCLWRRVGDTLIALGPLLLAVLLTQVSTVVFPISFTFGSVIVLPLLLGVGVDSGVHLVHRASKLGPEQGRLLSTTTARAVFFSAITTVASFGTLVVSRHVGIRSLGMLLVIGMLWTLAANLVLLPALLTLRARRRAI